MRSLVVRIVRILGFLNLIGCVAEHMILVPGSVTNPVVHSVIFSAILAFLRELPIIGTFLTLPYVREVAAALETSFPT